MKKYPMKLNYIAKSAIWGGSVLSSEWGKRGDGENVAETRELSVRPGEVSVIQNGEYAGMSLEDYVHAEESAVSPDYKKDQAFPMLVKFIDAGDKLSVQVHPDDAYANRVENDSGKTEMWHIVDAVQGATIIYGLADGVSKEDFVKAVEEKRLGDVMYTRPVKRGETYFIPAGLVHAIGAGIIVAEIQQNSDLTYRVYDYDRRGSDGKLRELHTQKALDVVRPYTAQQIDDLQFEKGRGEGVIAKSRYFGSYVKRVDGKAELCQSDASFASVLCLRGEGKLVFEGAEYPMSRGDSYFIPAGMGEYSAEGSMELLFSEI